MGWVLVVVILGTPVKTNLVFNDLERCLGAEERMRAAYVDAFNKWEAWARENPAASGYPGNRAEMASRIGLENVGTCIPHRRRARDR